MTAEGAPERTAASIAAAFAARPEVQAVALGGSQATGAADAGSDIDLYVYAEGEVDLAFRAGLAEARAARREIDNRFWETGDEWDEAASGIHVDVMYRSPAFAEDELARVLDRHEARIGYSTCLWHNILTSRGLFDRDGWFARLQASARRPYPQALAQAIVAKNHPLLREAFGAFGGQIRRAAERGDAVSVNHRTAAFLASYFDILFALNRTPHPGEKRLLAQALRLPRTPRGMAADVDRLLGSGTMDAAALVLAVEALSDGLDALVRSDA
ncbi:nucleotidyltransferase domain-containing protein [Aureimonas leprariae]|uniref:DUF4037 domain-containing protein n=1 Tax=Plantimonas leprariae TaxID=2615207 RepID=A0A7V7PNX3_9HYPH|nr:nucleotidyltransferase domain-containing protein [Aureimonas leprariae]KAB0679606.1 DUF4037 domain-containing protein [Aureimonas leprariae]